MAHRIELECVSCALCAEVCPEKCIVEDAETFVIDGEACTDCGDCVPACPIDCIIGERVGTGTATIDACLAPVGSTVGSDSPSPEPHAQSRQDLQTQPLEPHPLPDPSP
jgi:Fe-S-cluster-containing hydrogenase component 2